MNKMSSSKQNFKKALANLERSLASPIAEPRDQSGIIKDFEMSYELSWKVLKKLLLSQGHQTMGAKDVFTKAYQLGFLDNETTWLAMISDRNQTSHVYDETAAMEIIGRIQATYLHALQLLAQKYCYDAN